jgi:signal transduction histidine kinase
VRTPESTPISLKIPLERKISFGIAGALTLLLVGVLLGWSYTGPSKFAATLLAAVLAGVSAAIAGFALRRDVRLRKQAEDASRSSEIRYRSLFNALDEGFCVVEVIFDSRDKPIDYRFLEVNASFERQTGLIDAVGKTMRELAPMHETHWFEIYGRVATTGESTRFQNRAEQLHRWYDVYAFRLGDPELRQVAILFNDITDRRRAEAALVERTAQLEAANNELEAFSYSVSHDLRAPLRHIDGFGGMLEKQAASVLDEKARRYLTTIRGASMKMGTLIDDLLAFSRIGRGTLSMLEIDHDELVAAVIRDGHYDAEDRAIIWEVSPLPRVRGDAAMLRQVWSNLIANAVKYSRLAAPSRIAVGCLPGDSATEFVFFVRDNGVGFDPALVGKLFGVFQRLHDATQFEGTGIGLANVRRIVTRHGGRTWAEGETGKGATFFFSLPRDPAPKA